MKLVQTKDGSFTAYNEKAKEHYLKAIELNQYDPNPHANLAMVYLRLGNVEEARIELRKAKELEEYH